MRDPWPDSVQQAHLQRQSSCPVPSLSQLVLQFLQERDLAPTSRRTYRIALE
ncbi:hypothetical protein [Synechococcus sp. B60.1]|uniref:hypothetical protein n=1 Tax=unclassified Synechococcus TaxID=2626047 RepID=UPI0039C36406